jgi:hypothetical protein
MPLVEREAGGMNSTRSTSADLIIRPACGDDLPALRRLAYLDDRRVPRGDLVLAQVGGEIHAAVSAHDGAAIADPWRPTAGSVDALRAWTAVA